jgi:hypothetical protein
MLDCFRALQGNLTPSTEEEIRPVLRHAEQKTLIGFYLVFFAIREIPENAKRFQLGMMVQRARQFAVSPADAFFH